MPFSSANALRPACSSVAPHAVLKLYTVNNHPKVTPIYQLKFPPLG